jgi:tetratricopeptide (TPR) repeat protein
MKNSEKIEKYLENELNETERSDFETEMRSEKKLSAEVNLHKKVEAFLSDRDSILLNEKLNAIYDKEFGNKKSPLRIISSNWAKIAAVLAIGLLIGGIIFWKTHSLSNAEIYAQYAQLYDIGINVRGDSVSKLQTAYEKYDQRKFSEAIRLFESDASGNALNYGSRLCLGISYTELNQFEKAEQYFKSIIGNEPIYEQQAYWYLALMKLKAGQKAEAKQIFQKISKNQNHYQHQKAIEILKLMN